MEQIKENKMGTTSMRKLIWKMGLPMIVCLNSDTISAFCRSFALPPH